MGLFNQRPRVTPTELAQMTKCEQQMLFRRHGDKMTDEQKTAIRRGDAIHRQLETRGETFLAGNRSRKECFIATAVYGEGAMQTTILRKYRDDILLESLVGRAFVQTYYALSPPVAKLLTKLPWMKPVARAILDPIIELVKKCLP